jgi:voltage-gated potassium channel
MLRSNQEDEGEQAQAASLGPPPPGRSRGAVTSPTARPRRIRWGSRTRHASLAPSRRAASRPRRRITLIVTHATRDGVSSPKVSSGWVVVAYLLAFSTFYFAFSPFGASMPDWLAVLALAAAATLYLAFLTSLTVSARASAAAGDESLPQRARGVVDSAGGPWRVTLMLGWQNIFLFAALYCEAEFRQAGPTFTAGLTSQLDACYFSVMTLFTIGYGDISPVTTIARLLVIMQVLSGWVTLVLLGDRLSRAATHTA